MTRQRPSGTCEHLEPALVLNGVGEPVRLNCRCGREWRVLPIEWDVEVRK